MNERFKELENQATTVVEGWSDERGTTRYYEFNREKFAELLVLECIDVLEADDGATHMRELLLDHFGVDR